MMFSVAPVAAPLGRPGEAACARDLSGETTLPTSWCTRRGWHASGPGLGVEGARGSGGRVHEKREAAAGGFFCRGTLAGRGRGAGPGVEGALGWVWKGWQGAR